MKIAMLHSGGYPVTEGIGFFVEGLARSLVKRGHHVQMLTRGGPWAQEYHHADGYVVQTGPYLPLYPLHVHLQGMLMRPHFRSLNEKVDLFHLHSPLVPVPNTARGVVSTVHTPMRSDTQALELVDHIAFLARAQAPFSIALERMMLRRSNAITAVSEGVASELKAYGVPSERVTVVGNATDTSFFTPEPSSGSGAPSLFYAGRLGHRKGLHDLLAAFQLVSQALPQVTLRLAGDGPLASRLKACVERGRMADRVAFLGHISDRERLRDEYRRAGVYVQASHYEGLPTSLLEAMSCGRPVVATAIPGHVEVVNDTVNGRLVPKGNPVAMARALVASLRDADRARRMGRAARDAVCDRNGWPQVAERFERVYDNAVQ